MRESEILGHGLVENAKRMRKQHPAVERQRGAAAGTPCRAGKIAKTVDRNRRRFAERRRIKRRGEMGEVMLDIFDGAGKGSPRQRGELGGNARHLFAVAQPVRDQSRTWPVRRDGGEVWVNK